MLDLDSLGFYVKVMLMFNHDIVSNFHFLNFFLYHYVFSSGQNMLLQEYVML